MFCPVTTEVELEDGGTETLRCTSTVKDGKHWLESHRFVLLLPLDQA